MRGVLLILVADVFKNLAFGQQVQGLLYREGLGVSFGVIDGGLDLQASKVDAPEAFRDVHRVGLGMTLVPVQPSLILKTDCVNHKLISFPFPDRIAQPGGLRILGQRAAIGEDLPKQVTGFIEDHHESGQLKDLERPVTGVDPGHNRRPRAVSGSPAAGYRRRCLEKAAHCRYRRARIGPACRPLSWAPAPRGPACRWASEECPGSGNSATEQRRARTAPAPLRS